jgi:hypothetical protein
MRTAHPVITLAESGDTRFFVCGRKYFIEAGRYKSYVIKPIPYDYARERIKLWRDLGWNKEQIAAWLTSNEQTLLNLPKAMYVHKKALNLAP